MPQSLVMNKCLWTLRIVLLALLMLFPVLAQATAVIPGLAVAQSALQDLRLALHLTRAAQQTHEPELKKQYVQQSINVLVDARHADFDPNVAALGSGVGVRRYLIDLIERLTPDMVEKVRIANADVSLPGSQQSLSLNLSRALVWVNQAVQAGKIAVLTRDAQWAKNQLALMIHALMAAIGFEAEHKQGVRQVLQSLLRVAHVYPLVWRCFQEALWQCLLAAQSASE